MMLSAALILQLVAWQSASAYTLDIADGLVHEISEDLAGARIRIDYLQPGLDTVVRLNAGGVAEDVEVFEDGILVLDGGSVVDRTPGPCGCVWGYDRSEITILGGSVAGKTGATQFASISILDGSLWDLSLSGSAGAAVSGGSFEDAMLAQDDSTINVLRVGALASDFQFQADQFGRLILHGSNFALDGVPVDFGRIGSILGGAYYDEPERWLSGTLSNGYDFNRQIAVGGSAVIALVPEPGAALLVGLALAATGLRRRL